MKSIIITVFLATSLGSYAQYIDVSMIPYRQGDLWGYSSPDKQILIKPQFQEASWFSEGIAAVKKGNKWGYINRTGKLIIPAKYTVARPFRKGFMPKNGKEGGDSILFAGASVRTDGTEICINVKGQTLWKCPAIAENAVAENRIPIETKSVDKKYAVPNADGLFDKIMDDYNIPGSDKSFYIAVKNNRYGVFNSTFDTIVPFEYDSIMYNRSSGKPMLKIYKNGNYGMMYPDGKPAITPEFTSISEVNNDGRYLAIVKKNNQSYLKDLNKPEMISPAFNNIEYDHGGFVITDSNNMKGYYFNENQMIAPKYVELQRLRNTDYFLVKTFSGKTGYVDSSGREYFE